MPDISTVNGIDITTLSSFGGVAFADGQTLDGQNVALVSEAHTFISSQTASSSSSLSFTSGIDSTYDVYEFHLVNMHPATNSSSIAFQVDTGTNTNYNQTITSTFFRTKNHESGGSTEIAYIAGEDQQSGSAYQPFCNEVGNGNDESVSGVFTLYSPSNTTYMKHFASRMNEYHESDITMDTFCAGYVQTTSALTRVSFKFDNGNIDAGEIRMYGVATS